MSTDEDKAVSTSADKQLQEIEKKYPGFIHMKVTTNTIDFLRSNLLCSFGKLGKQLKGAGTNC